MTTAPADNNQTETVSLTATQQYWFEHLQKQQSSGLSMATYAKANGLTLHIFYYWGQKLREMPSRVATQSGPLFQKITLTAPQSVVETTMLVMVFRLPNHIECELRHADVRTCVEVVQSLARATL
jgi:hypothetical protein